MASTCHHTSHQTVTNLKPNETPKSHYTPRLGASLSLGLAPVISSRSLPAPTKGTGRPSGAYGSEGNEQVKLDLTWLTKYIVPIPAYEVCITILFNNLRKDNNRHAGRVRLRRMRSGIQVNSVASGFRISTCGGFRDDGTGDFTTS